MSRSHCFIISSSTPQIYKPSRVATRQICLEKRTFDEAEIADRKRRRNEHNRNRRRTETHEEASRRRVTRNQRESLFGFHMHKQSHAIIRLQVHLLGEQSVVFITDNVEAAAQNAASRDTTLTAWFKLNQQYQMATGILYYRH